MHDLKCRKETEVQMTYEQSIGLLNSRGANVTYDPHFLPPAVFSNEV